jgi:hypothetical protein
MATLSSLSQRRLIRVFIASPGDLGPERQRNVVCWLDRALYCAAVLTGGYRKRFQKEIGGLDSWCIAQKE